MEGGATDDGIPFSQDKKEFSKKECMYKAI